MASLADYIVLSDTTFSLELGETRVFSEPLPTNLVLGTDRARAILAFKVAATPSGGAFDVMVNGTTIFSRTLFTGDIRGLWEVFEGTILHPGLQNVFQVRASGNKIWFSDVVLWYQVNMP